MSKAVGLRADFDAEVLRRLARTSRNAGQSRRLLALASIDEGSSRTTAGDFGNDREGGSTGLMQDRYAASVFESHPSASIMS